MHFVTYSDHYMGLQILHILDSEEPSKMGETRNACNIWMEKPE